MLHLLLAALLPVIVAAACECNATQTCTSANLKATDPCSAECINEGLTAVLIEGNTTGVGYIECEDGRSTTTANKGSTLTTIFDASNGSTTTVGPTCITEEGITYCKIQGNARCETGAFTGTKLLVAKILSYLATAWVIIWCISTISTNVKHKNRGHHRWIHLYQEIFIILLYICIGVLNLTLRDKHMGCKITAILSHMFMVIILAAFLMEAIFADSMVHNKVMVNGILPPIVNYIIPIIIGLIPALITYFLEKDFYGSSGLHCFASVPTDMFWGFVIPVWVLILFVGLKSSLGNLACNMTDEDIQDGPQIHWAKKSCKILFFLSFFLLTCWLACLFGSSEQRFALMVLFFISSVILGPLIYISHTFCHENTSRRFFDNGCYGIFYRRCRHAPPAPPIFKPPPFKETPKHEEKKLTPPPSPKKKVTPPPSPTPPARNYSPPPPRIYSPLPVGQIDNKDTHGRSVELYNWATRDKKSKENANQILFRPRPAP